MLLYPAIDIKDGRCVRLLRGDYKSVTVYDQNPVNAAKRFIAEGAKRLHIVDLDGAKSGKRENFKVIREILSLSGAFAQVGGGIRDEETIRQYIEAGAKRVILGTIAVENGELLKKAVSEYGEKIAVGVDSRNGFLSTRGWLADTSVKTEDFIKKLISIGVSTAICTDISRDGAMNGIDATAYSTLSGIGGISIIASGGVTSLSDIKNLKAAGAAGAVLGRSLYDGAFTLSDALKIAEGE